MSMTFRSLLLPVLLLLAACAPQQPAPPPPPTVDSAFPEQSPEAERSVRFPQGAGIIDVTQAPYFAKGDGITDNSEVLQRAIHEHLNQRAGSRILYFPAGTYLISRPLTWQNPEGTWMNYLSLQGENRQRSILRLADHAPGFGDPAAPLAMVRTGSLGRWGANGNAGFANYFGDLTLSTGTGNPGAIALDYLGNNDTALRNLVLRSEDGLGHTGFASIRSNGGPYLGKNIRIDGFRTGIAIGHSWYGHFFEYLTLRNISETAVHIFPANGGNPQGPVFVVRRATLHSPVPFLRQDDPSALSVIEELRLRAAPSEAVLQFQGQLSLRHAAAPEEVEWVSELRKTKLDAFRSSEAVGGGPALALPVEETPWADPGDPAAWAKVTDFGADPTDAGDDTAGIQAALDSGAAVVLFPALGATNDAYLVSDTLEIPDHVTHLLGLASRVKPVRGDPNFYQDGAPRPVFRIRSDRSEALHIERFKIDEFWHFGKIESIHHHGRRPLVLREMLFENYRAFDNAGALFLESVACAILDFAPGQKVWGRHVNPETIGDKVRIDGGDFWVLGLKSEQASSLVTVTGGGRAEILGCVQTASPPIPGDVPIFLVPDGSLNASLAVRALSRRQSWSTLVSDGADARIAREQVPGRPYGEYDVLAPALHFEGRADLSAVPAAPPARSERAVPADGLVLRLEADAGMELDPWGQVAVWRDQSPHAHRVDNPTAARRPHLDARDSVPGLRFADDLLEIHLADLLHRRTLAARTWHLSFRSGPDVTRRQMLYHEGAASRGVLIYLEDGQLHFAGWNNPSDGPTGNWPLTHFRHPVAPDTAYTLSVVLDGRAPSLRMWVNGEMTDQTEQAGYFGAHAGGRSFVGVLFVDLPFPGEAVREGGPSAIESRGGTGFHGTLHRLLLWNRALSEQEIKDIE